MSDNRPSLSEAEFSSICRDNLDIDALFDHSQSRWFIRRDGENWTPDDRGELLHLSSGIAKDVAPPFKNDGSIPGTRFIAGALKIMGAHPEIAVKRDAWNADEYRLGAPGGTINLKAAHVGVGTPDANDMITKRLAVDPADDEDCPRWKAFLSEITEGDADVMRFFQQWFGYCLSGDMSEQKFVFLVGPGGNGKGVLLRTIARIMYDYAATAAASAFIDHGSTHPSDLAYLDGPHLVMLSETDKGGRWKESHINAVTGADEITARQMRQDFYTFSPRCKLVFVGNSVPNVAHVSDGLRRRFIIVPLEYKPRRVDPDLENALRTEWPGILRWLINGCLEWQRDGLTIPERVRCKTAEYFGEQQLLEQFLEDACTVESGQFESARTLYQGWRRFLEQKGEKVESARDFGQRLTTAGFKSQPRTINGRSERCRIGLSFDGVTE